MYRTCSYCMASCDKLMELAETEVELMDTLNLINLPSLEYDKMGSLYSPWPGQFSFNVGQLFADPLVCLSDSYSDSQACYEGL